MRLLPLPLSCLRALAAVAATLAPALLSAAEPDEAMVHIRARSELRLSEAGRSVGRDGRIGLRLLLALRDGPSQEPLGGQALRLSLAPAGGGAVTLAGAAPLRQRLSTASGGGANGVFLHLPPGRYLAAARYEGDDLHDGAEASLQVDLSRQGATARLSVPERAPLYGRLPIQLDLLDSASGAPLGGAAPVELWVSGQRFPVVLQGGHGELSLELPALRPALRAAQVATATAAAAAAPPAPPHGGDNLSLLLSYAGDALHAGAQTRAQVLLTTRTELTLDPPPGEAAQSTPLLLTGTARDEDGPLSGEQIEVSASPQTPWAPREGEAVGTAVIDPGPHLLASTTTDAAGRFRLRIERLPLWPGVVRLIASSVPGRSYRQPGQSAPAILTVRPPEPVSVLYFLLPLLATLVGLLCAAAVRRRRVLFALLGRLLPARLRQTQAAAPESLDAAVQPGPGVRLSPRSRPATLRFRRSEAGADRIIDGLVGDAVFGGAVAGASIELGVSADDDGVAQQAAIAQPAAIARQAEIGQQAEIAQPAEIARQAAIAVTLSDRQGRFVLLDVPAGTHLVRIAAPGYLPQRFTATLPHRGELRGVRVSLLPIRAGILDAWRRVALPFLPDDDALTWTPREVLGHVKQDAPLGLLLPLRQLTDLVEHAYYSHRPCTPQMLGEANHLSAQVADQRVQRPEQLAGQGPQFLQRQRGHFDADRLASKGPQTER